MIKRRGKGEETEGMEMDIDIKLDKGAYVPQKAHPADAGFDIRTPVAFTVPAGGSAVIDTRVHMQIPDGYVGFLKSKSGLHINDGITCEGVIDSGYTGSIVAKLYNYGERDKAFDIGDKITQIVIIPIPHTVLVPAGRLGETERGDNGFGSSGK